MDRDKRQNFFTLIDTKRQVVFKVLEKLGLGPGIIVYDIGSKIIHNSTFESFYSVGNNTVLIDILCKADDVQRLSLSIASDCHVITLFLILLKRKLWIV